MCGAWARRHALEARYAEVWLVCLYGHPQYFTYYADSATLREVPVVGEEGYHRDDWEGVEIRIEPDGQVSERASSHHGYSYSREDFNWAADAGLGPLSDLAELLDARPEGGWGPETHLLLVSGGSHAGNASGHHELARFTPGRRVHLLPLEPIAVGARAEFAISPPWRKKVWTDPETSGTN